LILTNYRTALIVIDMQKAIDAEYWAKDGPRNHRNAEIAGMRLLRAWREAGRPVFHVRHDSVEPMSSYRPGQPGNQFKDGFTPGLHERIIPKSTGSAFTGTGFEDSLRAEGIEQLVICGVITNNSVESNVRHGATLGFRVLLAEDACFTFARRDFDGVLHSAQTVHAMSLANLDAEYCQVVTSAELLAGIPDSLAILPYFERVASYHEWDPNAADAAAQIPGFEHIGSSAVPGCPGKGILDGMVLYKEGELEMTRRRLFDMGFQPQPGRDPFPDTRPMLVGAIAHNSTLYRIHAHVLESTSMEVSQLREFRDRLRADPQLVASYAARKREILESGILDSVEYCDAKAEFIRRYL
jgi:nicotinamidase-related amidase/GrpB-like predicted nucleotidyltransferase (UPF0157 family)